MNSSAISRDSPVDAWRIDESGFPRYGAASQKIAFLLRYAILASSPYNTQPWRFRVTDSHADLFADTARWLPRADPQGRQMIAACGAALFNLRTAAACHGLALAIVAGPDPDNPDWLARIALAGAAKPRAEDAALLRAIPMRRTHHKSFDAGPPSPSLLASLKQAAAVHAVELAFVPDAEAQAAVADVVAEAQQRNLSNPRFVAEREQWLRPEQSDRPDGIRRSYLLSLRKLPDFGAPEWAQKLGTAETGSEEAQRLRGLVRAAPVLALLSSPRDARAQWLAVGEALKHVVLTARNAGVWASYLNAPIEYADLRARLGGLFRGGALPQVMLRMGYGCEPPPTARRAVADVLLGR